MAKNKVDLAAQSYCFRNFKDNKQVIKMLKECGLAAVELCGVHADFSQPEEFKEVLALYQEAGITICSIGVQAFADQPAVEKNFFECTRLAGAQVMSVNFQVNTFPQCLQTAEKMAEEYDINLAIHNHGGRHWLGSTEMLAYIFSITSPRIGLCLDTGWALDSGEDPVAMIENFGSRLYSLHIKDFVFDRARNPQPVAAGEGNLNLEALAVSLKKIGFRGWAIIEYEGEPDNPVPAVTKSASSTTLLQTGA